MNCSHCHDNYYFLQITHTYNISNTSIVQFVKPRPRNWWEAFVWPGLPPQNVEAPHQPHDSINASFCKAPLQRAKWVNLHKKATRHCCKLHRIGNLGSCSHWCHGYCLLEGAKLATRCFPSQQLALEMWHVANPIYIKEDSWNNLHIYLWDWVPNFIKDR